MSWLDGFRHRLGTLFHPGRRHEDLAEEMADHEARDAAYTGDGGTRRRFGGRLYHREEVRRLTWLHPLDVIRQDVTTAWRAARRRPWMSAMIVATLALGIGANAAAFSVIDQLFLRTPAGIHDPATLRSYWVEYTRTADGVPFWTQSMNYPTVRAVREASGNADSVAAFLTDNALHLGRHPGGSRVRAVFASANYFNVLGVRLIEGRPYTAEEDRFGAAASVLLVSDAFRRRELGDSTVVGRMIAIGRTDYTIIGVIDPAFRGLDFQPADVWIPLAALPAPGWVQGPWWESTNMNAIRLVERGGRGILEVRNRATAMVRSQNRVLTPAHPDTLMRATPGPLIEGRGPARPGRENTIATRLAAVTAIVLIIAWANVVNLLLTRALDRRREIALRVALGISRWRLVRILTIESLGFAVAAAAGALLLAWEGGTLLRGLLFPGIDWTHAAVGWRVAEFTGLVALLSGVGAGVVPGWQATRPAFADALRTASAGGRVRSRLASGLVVVQAGLSMTLLVGAALFVRSLQKVQSLDIGLDTNRLLFASAEFDEGDSPPEPIVLTAYQDIAARLRTRPDVDVVARASWEPMMGFGSSRFFTDTDSAESFLSRFPIYSAVTPEFFEATGLRMVRGNGFAAAAAGHAGEVVVNEAMAAQVWPGREALGQCLRIRERTNPCHVVTGVVENANQSYLIEQAAAPQFYLPLGTPPFTSAGVLVIRADPRRHAAIARDLRRELTQALPAGLPVTRRMIDNLEPEYRPWRLGATLFAAVSGLALLVALMGIYSSVSFGVGRRTHEFAVRSALGARLGTILWQVIAEELRPVALGVVLGAAAALAAAPLIASMLFGVAAANLPILGAVAVTLLVAGAGAALIPARRASQVDPMVVLKAD